MAFYMAYQSQERIYMEDLYQNQPEEEGLFDDLTEEDLTEYTNEEETSEESIEETETAPQETPSESFLTVKYDKQDRGLTKEEAVAYAQKGMNYDRLNEHYAQLNDRFNTMNDRISKLAKQAGLEPDVYLARLEDAQNNFEVTKRMNDLKATYPEANEGLLKQLAEGQIEKERAIRQAEQQKTLQQSAQAQRGELERQVEHFKELYPDVAIQDIAKNEDVLDLMRNGYTLLEAYQVTQAKIAKANAEANAKKQEIIDMNNANKSRSYGNTNNAGDIEADPFLAGLFDD